VQQHQYVTYGFTEFLTEFLTFSSFTDARQNVEICLHIDELSDLSVTQPTA